MWDEIQDMPGEIFDISDETREEMAAAWDEEDLTGWEDCTTLADWDEWGHPLAECWHDMDLNSVPDEAVAQEVA